MLMLLLVPVKVKMCGTIEAIFRKVGETYDKEIRKNNSILRDDLYGRGNLYLWTRSHTGTKRQEDNSSHG
jgi:hypothetical protein